jgi:hypothetical protein
VCGNGFTCGTLSCKFEFVSALQRSTEARYTGTQKQHSIGRLLKQLSFRSERRKARVRKGGSGSALAMKHQTLETYSECPAACKYRLHVILSL